MRLKGPAVELSLIGHLHIPKSPNIENLPACLKEILKEKNPKKYSDKESIRSRFYYGETDN
jgi:hypothetical protein